MTTDKNFLGMPVSGDITEDSTRTDQKPIEELAPLFQALLDDPTIVEFGWRQYTPYFNDGEPCEFSVHGLWVRTTSEVETENEHFGVHDLFVDYHLSLGRYMYDYVGEGSERRYTRVGYEGPDEARFDQCQELRRALESGAFDAVLLKTFGDHAMITVRSAGIEVEFYEHD